MFTEENRHVSLLHAINKILIKDWDPLRIYRNPALQDEYEEYLPVYFDSFANKPVKLKFLNIYGGWKIRLWKSKGIRPIL